MRILLRNFETGTFFKTATEWKRDPNEALDFMLSGPAIEMARALHFKNIEIVYVSDDGTQVSGPKIQAPEAPDQFRG
jgi:hypothetical protein